MLRSDTSPPLPVFTPPEGRTAYVDVLIPVDPDRTLLPGDLEELLGAVANRVDKALESALGDLPAEVRVDMVAISNPRHNPVFPVALGGEHYKDRVDIAEAVERLWADAHPATVLHDSGGRAFRWSVWIHFQRAAEADRSVSEVWTLDPGARVAADPADDVYL